MELKKLKDFIDFMNANNLSELEIEEEGEKIRLKKHSPEQKQVVISPVPAPAETAKSAVAEHKKEGVIEIKSPMVGTFYRSPAPGAKPYVEVDDNIKPGDTVCIIEAMKLMNEIKGERGGKILKIMVENGQPVEFGQVLFLIETA